MSVNNSLWATKPQKFFTYAGYYSSAFARELARDIERLTRPMPQGNDYWEEAGERVKRAVFACACIPLATALFIPSMSFYTLASYIGHGRFELIEPKSLGNPLAKKSIKVLSLNACLQDPWSPLTGGVVPPLEPVADCASRTLGIVNAIAKEDPIVCMGQEFESLAAQDECIRLMQQKGFAYFLRDLGSNDPICNNSGLFVASKVPLENIEFTPYPSEDREGLAKWSNQGALTFTVSVKGKDLRFVNVHLNYGEGQKNQDARNRQLKRHVIPLLNKEPSVVLGDLNFSTDQVSGKSSGLSGLTNALEGRVTCTDEGKHALRGKKKNPTCSDCQEKIDGLLYDPGKIQVLNFEVKPLKLKGQLLSDHYATIATVKAISL